MNKWMLLLIAVLLQACGSSDQSSTSTATEDKVEKTEEALSPTEETLVVEVDQAQVPVPAEDLPYMGYYVGYFEGVDMDFDKDPVPFNKITISVDSLSENTLFGHSVVAGNQRPFTGPYVMSEDSITVVASEPGDDRYDGVFTFTILPQERLVKGTWAANNKRLAVSTRQYTLEQKTFAYQADLDLPEEVSWSNLYEKHPRYEDKEESLTEDVLKFNASTIELKKEDIENMYQGDLEVIRNAIYARHGYSFKNRKMRFIFDHGVDWYMPVSTDIRAQLTSLEKKNIALLKRYEQHAERYYDVFGR